MLRRAVAINSIATAANIVVQLLSVAAISRLLTPSQIGSYSVSAAIASILVAFRDIGISLYIVQERDLSKSRLNSAITLLAISCWILGFALFLSAEAVAAFYRSAELAPIIQLIALNFVVIPWVASISAQMQRELAYGQLAITSVASGVAGIIMSIMLAWQGYGAISLAWGTLAATGAQLLCLGFFRPAYLIWAPNFQQTKHVISFGWRAMVGSIAQQAAGAAPDLIIGKSLGLDSVALFNRAMAIRSLVATHLVQVVQATLIPKFAAEHRASDLSSVTFLYRNRFITGLFIPIYGLSVALAEPMTLLLFGPQWAASIPLAQLLCISPIFAMPYALTKTAVTATGQMGALARLELLCLSTRVAAIYVGALHSLALAAGLMIIENIVYALVLNHASRKHLNLRALELYRNSAGDYVIGLITGLSAFLASQSLQLLSSKASAPSWLSLLIGLACGAAAFLALLPLLNRPLFAELNLAANRIAPKLFRHV